MTDAMSDTGDPHKRQVGPKSRHKNCYCCDIGIINPENKGGGQVEIY